MQFYDKALIKYNQYADTPKKKNYFEIAATLALLIILIIMIYPAITHIIELNKEISAGKVVEQTLVSKISDLEIAKTNLAAIQSDLPLLELALPTGSNIKTYLQKPLENLAAANSLKIQSVQFTDLPISQPEATSLEVRDMPFTINITGDFVNFTTFLKQMESFIRVTNVDKIDIKKQDQTVSATIQATTNYLGSPVTVVNKVGAQ